MNIEELLSKLIGHKVTLTFTPHEETVLREASGVLVKVNKDLIQLRLYNNYGESENFYLNRHGCTLHSITDEGVAKK